MKLINLNLSHLDLMLQLTLQLNPDLDKDILSKRQRAMFEFENYYCFGCFEQDQLIGISSGWMTVRLYSGKQLEIDNFVMDVSIHSKGHGKQFLELIEVWCKTQDCETVELNTYVSNYRSHKFYFNQGYKILGFHFQKLI